MSEPSKQSEPQGKVQGEGDYEAAQRYREEVKSFVDKADINKLAQQAKPGSAKEASELEAADQQGHSRSKGDDPADVGIMSAKEDKKRKGA
jgi:hypothetical protein